MMMMINTITTIVIKTITIKKIMIMMIRTIMLMVIMMIKITVTMIFMIIIMIIIIMTIMIVMNSTRKIPVPQSRNMTDVSGLYQTNLAHLIKGIGPKRHKHFYSLVLEFFLCYSYPSDSTLRTSIFPQFLL